MQNYVLLKLTLILLASNNALGDSCPVLNVTYQILNKSPIKNILEVYQYKEVDPVIISPFYGIGDKFSKNQWRT